MTTRASRSERRPSIPSPIALKNAAVRAAEAAGRVLMKRYRRKLQIRDKPGRGVVTDADVASEKVIIAILRKAYPDFGILAEESDPVSGGSGRWIIDPLDGTTGFAHGYDHFCVSIAAEWEGEVVAGVIHQPVSGDTYWAVRGKGAFHNAKRMRFSGRRMRVSEIGEMGQAFLTTGFSSDQRKWLRSELAIFEKISRSAQGVRRPGSAALDLALVARGVFDGFWELGLSPWDVAAGALMVEEAGGKVTSSDWKPSAVQILASNGRLHPVLLREIEPVLRPQEQEHFLSRIVDNRSL